MGTILEFMCTNINVYVNTTVLTVYDNLVWNSYWFN